MDLGERITAWRRWKGWTQRQLADAADVSYASICQYENQAKYKSSPSQRSLAAIVAAIGVTMERFYGRPPKAKKAAA